jgi:hypothetical protein
MKLFSLRALFAFSATASLTVGAVLFAGACSEPDADRITLVIAPDFAAYSQLDQGGNDVNGINGYLERRCGTLDCHGQPGRAYRLYSRNGLRLYDPDAKLSPGGPLTTPLEIQQNYQSLIGLEPEEMSRVMGRAGTNPNTLLLLRKPLNLERHKGGRAMAEDDVGYRCITGWLRLAPNQPLDADTKAFCQAASRLP